MIVTIKGEESNVIEELNQTNNISNIIKIVINRKIIVKDKWQDKDFRINCFHKLSNLVNEFNNKIDNIEDNFSKLKYDDCNIYHISILELMQNHKYLYYIKYKQIEKTNMLYLRIRNLRLTKKLKLKQKKLNKINNFLRANKKIYFFKNNRYHNLSVFKNINNVLNRFNHINTELLKQSKIYTVLNEKYLYKSDKIYIFFKKILKIKNLVYEKNILNNELISEIKDIDKHKSFKIKLLKENIKNLSIINNNLKLNINKDLCNKKAKFISLKI